MLIYVQKIGIHTHYAICMYTIYFVQDIPLLPLLLLYFCLLFPLSLLLCNHTNSLYSDSKRIKTNQKITQTKNTHTGLIEAHHQITIPNSSYIQPNRTTDTNLRYIIDFPFWLEMTLVTTSLRPRYYYIRSYMGRVQLDICRIRLTSLQAPAMVYITSSEKRGGMKEGHAAVVQRVAGKRKPGGTCLPEKQGEVALGNVYKNNRELRNIERKCENERKRARERTENTKIKRERE